MAISIYLFESKGIQAYLGRSGRLADVVTVSDALANLINDNEHSDLALVLNESGLLEKSDLLDSNNDNESNDIHFFRKKGGSFYCWSADRNILCNLRTVWTLYFQNTFPGMAYTDSLVTDTKADCQKNNDFHNLLNKAFSEMTGNFNRPSVMLPVASPVCQSTPRTGQIAVREERYKNRNEYRDLTKERTKFLLEDRHCNRRYFTEYLYDKTIPEKIPQASSEKTSQENNDTPAEYRNAYIQKLINYSRTITDDTASARDVALIHMDGNGVGQTLMALKTSLKNKDGSEYSKRMSKFSEILENITGGAVKDTMEAIIRKAGTKENFFFRPLVVGGDDVTVLIEPRFAYDFVINFCKNFYKKSKEAINHKDNKDAITPIADALQKAGKPAYLSASGGILFNKISHPFYNSLRIVEGLAEKAKRLTKYIPENSDYTEEDLARLNMIIGDKPQEKPDTRMDSIANNRLYSAISVMRMSVASTVDVEGLITSSRHRRISDTEYTTGDTVYFVNNDEFDPSNQPGVSGENSGTGNNHKSEQNKKLSADIQNELNKVLTLEDIIDFVNTSNDRTREINLSKLMGRIRKITGHIMNSNQIELERELTMLHKNLVTDEDSDTLYNEFLALLSRTIFTFDRFSFHTGSEDGEDIIIRKVNGNSRLKATILDDLLIAYHFINEENQTAEYRKQRAEKLKASKENDSDGRQNSGTDA